MLQLNVFPLSFYRLFAIWYILMSPYNEFYPAWAWVYSQWLNTPLKAQAFRCWQGPKYCFDSNLSSYTLWITLPFQSSTMWTVNQREVGAVIAIVQWDHSGHTCPSGSFLSSGSLWSVTLNSWAMNGVAHYFSQPIRFSTVFSNSKHFFQFTETLDQILRWHKSVQFPCYYFTS